MLVFANEQVLVPHPYQPVWLFEGSDCWGPSTFLGKPHSIDYNRVDHLMLVDVWNFAVSEIGLAEGTELRICMIIMVL